ncbi:hypothetical protein [Legionella cherrii]|uniref:Uncharacterized protein n=1 Tax=Legionella cherrii TaxID=28084 RepID=A0ABY6T1I1_9GAMM|nr:hypothetical protein [Legionella cherrii]VEB32896.1 Uncharacterised protein [Legionella cherrii]
MIRTEDVFKSDFKGPIVLHMIDQEGYGDVSLAMKIAKFLMNKYPDAPIYVLGKKESIQKVHQIEPNLLEQCPQIQMVDSSNQHKVDQVCHNAKLAVETAIFDNSLKHYYKNNNCPKIFVGEYGLYKQTEYESPIICLSGNVGVGDGYPGILIEDDLKKFSHLDPTKKREARSKILSELDPPLKKQVFGKSPEDSSFLSKNNFAFSYYNFPKSYKRAATVFAASNEQGKHANYFISASSKNGKDKMVFSMLEEPDFLDKLKKLGYGKLVFFTGDSENPHKEIILDETNPNGREFRAFQRDRFIHDTTLDLMRLSDLCGVAGDQSLTEAHSLGAVPIPEEWYCQLSIIGQIAKTYYNHNVMGGVFNNTWGHHTSIDQWADAGKELRVRRSEVETVLTKFQEEANLYNALDYRLNLELDGPHQKKVEQYNQQFIKALAEHQKTLKKDKADAFNIATEIAAYYAKWQPGEMLTMGKIVDTMRAYEGKRLAHIDTIHYVMVQKKYHDLVSSERSGSFIKRNITHKPSHNEQLFKHLQSIHQQHFFSGASNVQAKNSMLKERLSDICHPLTDEELERALKYLANLEILELGQQVGFASQNKDKTLSEAYHLIEKIIPCEQEKPIGENKKFAIFFQTNYATDEVYRVTLSKEQIQAFAEKQKVLQPSEAFNC